MRIWFEKLPVGHFMRDKEIGMEFVLISEETGAIKGYVNDETIAREISQSSGCVLPSGANGA